MDISESPFSDSRFITYWVFKLSILPRRCKGTKKFIVPFTKAWYKIVEHKYIVLTAKTEWYSDEYIVWSKLKGET